MIIIVKNNHWILKGFSARTILFFIFLSESNKENKDLIVHEKEHVRQLIYPKYWFYSISSKARYRSELDAYTKQIRYLNKVFRDNNPGELESVYTRYNNRVSKLFAKYLSSNYNLDKSKYSEDKIFNDFIYRYKGLSYE